MSTNVKIMNEGPEIINVHVLTGSQFTKQTAETTSVKPGSLITKMVYGGQYLAIEEVRA